jgi:hypothetical protein
MRNLIFWIAQTIPQDLQERGEEIVETVKANPGLMWTLVGVGVITALIFVLGIIKHAVKAAVIGAVLSVAAWIWYFNIR